MPHQLSWPVSVGVAAALSIAGAVAVLTLGLSDTESTSRLDQSSTVVVHGRPALAPTIVAGRTLSRYHPLPWIGLRLTTVHCPSELPAVTGARITCTGTTAGGSRIEIPVLVLQATTSTLTWSFQR
ncbi:MAG TPA: DUF4333 domain-containing protein [Rugosimonospora sp.]|nr:DUF4333 domain-containing protein [Rugosimonospora sp.]